MEFFKDRTGAGSPAKRLAVGVVVRDKLNDALHPPFDTGEAAEQAPPDGLVGDQREESLDLVWLEVTACNEMQCASATCLPATP